MPSPGPQPADVDQRLASVRTADANGFSDVGRTVFGLFAAEPD